MNSEKGVSLIITFFIMIIVLAVVLSISIILYNEIKVIRNIGDSVVAFYIADSGVEKTLFYDRKVVPDDATGNKRGACNICASCPDCTCTSQPSGSACKPASCENCTITFNSSLAGNKTYSVIAKVFPSVNDNTFSAISIDSIGSYNHAIGVDAVKRAIELNVVKQETGQPIPPLTVIATSPGSAPINQPVTFFAIASPPDIGNYSYDWSGACTGTGSSCTASFSAPKVYSATVLVTDLEDSSRTASAVASVTITPPAPWTICGDNLTDSRDNKTYGTVKIGNQCWMAQNLNVGARVAGSVSQGTSCSSIQKYCYNDSDTGCSGTGKYGGLYQWSQAMCGSAIAGTQGICPAGWHIPTHDEFTTLERVVCASLGTSAGTCANYFPYNTTTIGGRGANEGTALKDGGSSGFNGVYAGGHSSIFFNVGLNGYFWSSLQDSNTSDAWVRYLYTGSSTVFRDNSKSKTNGFSVRCVKN